MNSSKYISLLVKKFRGKLDTREQEALEPWLSSDDGQTAANEMERVWDLSNQYKGNYEPNVEAGLARFKKRIAEESKPQGRVVDLPRRRFSLSWAAAIAVLILAAAWLIMKPGNAGPALAYTLEEEQKTIELPDGSTVVLNEKSELDYTAFDKNDVRLVRLSGEAYFDVQPDAQHPFVILTEESEVKVLGTSFNVRAYPAESYTEVEVEHGKVAFRAKGQDANEILQIKERGHLEHGDQMTKAAVSAFNGSSWRTNTLSFEGTALRDVTNYLERHLKVKIDMEPGLGNCKITSDFSTLDRDKVFLTIEKILNAKLEQIDHNHFLLKGRACN